MASKGMSSAQTSPLDSRLIWPNILPDFSIWNSKGHLKPNGGHTQMELLLFLPKPSSLSGNSCTIWPVAQTQKPQQSALISPLSSCPPGGLSPYLFVLSPESSQISRLLRISTSPSWCKPSPVLPGLPQALDCFCPSLPSPHSSPQPAWASAPPLLRPMNGFPLLLEQNMYSSLWLGTISALPNFANSFYTPSPHHSCWPLLGVTKLR